MDKKIEIFENTLLKLLVRRGIDIDRQQVKLSVGELGYTTDTKRLYIGDGQTFGGNIAGNLFLGSTADVTTLANVCSGDLAYDDDNNRLYSFIGGASNTISNWKEIGGVQTPLNTTINLSPGNQLSVGTLSAGNFSSDALGSSLTIDTGRISLSSSISTDRIISQSNSHLELPSTLKIGPVLYDWPTGGYGADLYLKSNIDGGLSWSTGTYSTSLFVSNTAGLIPVGTIMSFVSATNAPPGWLLCNGQSVPGVQYRALSAVIGTTYGGDSTNFNVPNLINRTLYGVNSNPANSTLFRISSGTNASLSATGVLYVIKAIPDSVVNSTITINSPLTSTGNGISTTDTATGILSTSIAVGLPPVISHQTVSGPFNVDEFGRVVAASSFTDRLSSAGIVTDIPFGSSSTPVYNTASPISFLQTPVEIYNNTTTTIANSLLSTISAYPRITRFDNGSVTNYSIPLNAKNLIVDCSIKSSSNNVSRYVLAAPNRSLLSNIASLTPGSTEYIVGYNSSTGQYSQSNNFNQAFLPLSATASGDLVCAFRLTSSTHDTIVIRAIGYTL